jgi:hypothetical protein
LRSCWKPVTSSTKAIRGLYRKSSPADTHPVRPPQPTVALNRPIRSTRRLYIFAAFAWLFAAAMIATGATGVSSFEQREGLLAALGFVTFFAAISVPAIWYAMRVRRAELRVSAKSVVVRNPVRCYVASLDEVDEFRAGNATPHGNNGTPGIVVRLKDGRALPVFALAEEGSIFSIKKKTQAFRPLADQLNELLQTARQAAR